MIIRKNKNFQSFRGLSKAEVEHSRKIYGRNEIKKTKKKSFISQYLASFGDPIIRILLIALGINIVFLFKHTAWYESAGIAFAVLIATLVSTLSEYGSESAFEKLQQEAEEINCRVERNNHVYLLPITDLVVGDLVLLQSGEKIPADGRIVYGELFVDQSVLSGESKEMRKYANTFESADENDLLSRSRLFRGSVVCDGQGAMIVDRVGAKTLYGKLAVDVQTGAIKSPLKARLQKLAGMISRFGYTVASIVAIASLFNTFVMDNRFNMAAILSSLSDLPFVFETLMNTLTLSITVLVMSVPEGLPMMITVVLSANMKKMLKDKVLVRKLVGIETSGSLNILFTDKTGTLTEGRLLVTGFLSGNNTYYNTMVSLKKSPLLWQKVMMACIYNTDSQISGQGQNKRVVGGNSTDRALLEYALPYMDEIKNVSLLSHEPFSSKKKYSQSHILYNNRDMYIIKGAPEIIIPKCKYYFDGCGNKKPFNASSIQWTLKLMGRKSIRMLALAESSLPIDRSHSNDFNLVGIICIRDQVRKGAPSAIKQIINAGIQTVMITGDNKETAISIAKEVGLLNNNSSKNAVYTSEELAGLSDSELADNLRSIRVIARAMPTDKSRLVQVAQKTGLVVGMTGDGVNDAPALKKADVGFSMGSGTEVAKAAGDIIIMENNISSIAKAILYGRTIFKSIRKFIIYQLTMNLCAVSLSAICPFLGIDAPLTVMQMLWLNMIMDTLGGLAFSGEAPLEEYMNEPPKKRDEPIINSYMYSQILYGWIYLSGLCLIFLKLPLIRDFLYYNGGSDYFMTAFFAFFIFSGVFTSLNSRTYRINLLSGISQNRIFVFAMLLVCLVQLLLIYFGGAVFRTTAIRVADLLVVIILASTVIPMDIMRKLWLRKMGKVRQI